MALLRFVAVATAFGTAAAACEGDACEDGAAAAWTSLLQDRMHLTAQRGALQSLPPKEHYWPRRGGNARMSSSTPFKAPTNFSTGPSWVWENELDEQVRHSPLIDRDMNVYVTTGTRMRKFSRSGDLLWTWMVDPSHGPMVMCPALYNSTIFAVAGAALGQTYIYSIDIVTARVNWVKSHDQLHGREAMALFAYNDTLIVPARNAERHTYGCNKFIAMDAHDGSQLWEYETDDVVWNAAVATPGDGSLLAATNCGGVVKIGWDGKLIWKSGTTSTGKLCSTGGGALGEDGVYYTEYNDPGLSTITTHAVIAAYRVTDGMLLWNKTFDYQGWQYPAVGRLGNSNPRALVAAIGSITMLPGKGHMIEKFMAMVGKPASLPNAVVAMNADTGSELWRFEEPPWNSMVAAGDTMERFTRVDNGTFVDRVCLPDIQGIPLIAGDGTVYASSSHDGTLRAIRDVDGNGEIDESEVSAFHTGNCFLNSPSLAPGMLVAAPCWGPMYVFLD